MPVCLSYLAYQVALFGLVGDVDLNVNRQLIRCAHSQYYAELRGSRDSNLQFSMMKNYLNEAEVYKIERVLLLANRDSVNLCFCVFGQLLNSDDCCKDLSR